MRKQITRNKFYLPRQESIIRKIANDDTVNKLNRAGKHQEQKECIDKFETIRRLVVVCLPESEDRRLLSNLLGLGRHCECWETRRGTPGHSKL